ncbi:cold shock domain-containing protein [Pseudochryseolinea flava]|uniref:Cold shock domain-containing protein n=1 Tax=Pseudochryseolinea flava TaxID=2059302 RepID=A0A364Y1R1_9BACT|nr:cold shock domain-containing protein [Pseudochryseolinea flava]RAW00570.1 cold shock domain-containing protein [Pseudochryseolinea flava]
MAETFNKKEKEKQKQQKKKEKEQRKAERKANKKPGQSWEDMIAYMDENGNLSSTPPDPNKKQVINQNDIVLGSRNIEGMITNPIRKGRVTYFNKEKGYGFIKDLKTQESIFVHSSVLTMELKENNMVSFETENGFKGLTAINVKMA